MILHGGGATDRASLVERLASAPERVAVAAREAAAVEGAAGGPPSGEWTAREAVGHLVSVEIIVWQARLDSLQGDGAPAWPWTEPGPVDDPRAATLDGAIALFAEARAATMARLGALDEAGWARAGVHATFGRLDVPGLMGIAADHDDEHVAALAARGA